MTLAVVVLVEMALEDSGTLNNFGFGSYNTGVNNAWDE